MANFNPPFASNALFRYPTLDERQNGFPCGPADRQLFGGLLHRLESEIGEVISFAGLEGSDGDLTQLRQAIEALIASAIAQLDPPEDPDLSGFLSVNQARSRLPIFPIITSASGTIPIIAPSTGVIRVPAGASFFHRGIFPITTTQVDLNTDPSKVYHLRWSRTGGDNGTWSLQDLASPSYNPDSLPETAPNFDSTYDDMLAAKITTNSSNVAQIIPLVNLDRLMLTQRVTGTGVQLPPLEQASLYFTGSITFNWARTPVIRHVSGGLAADPTIRGSMDWGANMIQAVPTVTRYGASAQIRSDWREGTSWFSSAAYIDFSMVA